MDWLIHLLLIAFLQILMTIAANFDDDIGVSLGSSAGSRFIVKL
jgi:hypothetical protein